VNDYLTVAIYTITGLDFTGDLDKLGLAAGWLGGPAAALVSLIGLAFDAHIDALRGDKRR